ncbi:MAG: sodium/glutamate symporter [Gammaproteobacteria bacterium]
MDLDARQTIIIAILVLFIGKYLNKKIGLFQNYNIPEPVTGGVLASLIFAIIYFSFDFNFQFALESRDNLLIVFFTTIGLSSRFSTLVQGGKSLVILLVLAVVYLFLQNLTGLSVATISGMEKPIGILGSSVSLSGGHGTAIAWAPVFRDNYGISNAVEIGIACATFGLVLGGIIGGPIAQFLIQRHKLETTSTEHITVGTPLDDKHKEIDVDMMLNVILIVGIAVGIGINLNRLLVYLGVQLPMFVSCLFAGILLTNTVPFLFKKMHWPTGTPSLALVSDLSLSLFLAMSLMSLQLWTLIDLAGPILLLLLAQVILITFFVVVILFRVLGHNYDAAVMSAGYAGLAMGATPTAIANMTAVTRKFGASPKAFIVVPLVGAFFIDIANAFIIQFMLDRL